MSTFVLRRLVQTIPILIGISAVTFALINVLPGDPLVAIAGENPEVQLSPSAIAALKADYGLDQPLPIQYLRYLGRLAHGDLGRSYRTRQQVLPTVLSRMPATLQLAAASLFVSLLIAFPLGILSAVKRGTWFDGFSILFATTGVSVPTFWAGLMLIVLFAVKLGWLPSSGFGDAGPDRLKHLILPAFTLGAAGAGLMTRLIRSSMLEALDQEYLITARAKGLQERTILLRHALRNAGLPVVTLLGVQIGSLLSGSVVIESIFAWPGVGRLAFDSIGRRDLPMVQGVVLLSSLVFLVINLCVDLAYGLLDPRIRLSGRR